MRQWDDRDRIVLIVFDDIPGDMREDLWWQLVDWPQKVPQEWDEPQNILRSGFQIVDLSSSLS